MLDGECASGIEPSIFRRARGGCFNERNGAFVTSQDTKHFAGRYVLKVVGSRHAASRLV